MCIICLILDSERCCHSEPQSWAAQPQSWAAQPQLLSQYRAAADDITTYTPLYSSAPLCFCLPASLLLGPWTRHSGLLSGTAASDAAAVTPYT